MDPLTPLQKSEAIRARQRARARVMALMLGGFCILMFAITIAKIRAGMGG
ncbi:MULTISPECIES: hypothetical protein [unclassified Sphingomonas]|jgi:hypothetical protein|nr:MULTISPECIES: hypothetical protein [unclassified Sphingomonas]